MRKQPSAAKGQDGERVGSTFGGNRCALERIERNVDLGPAAADLFTDEQHRCFVAFAFADHHGAVYFQLVERRSHGIDCGLVGRLFVTAAHQLECRQRCGFGDAHRFHGKITIEVSHRSPYRCSMRMRWGCSSTVSS